MSESKEIGRFEYDKAMFGMWIQIFSALATMMVFAFALKGGLRNQFNVQISIASESKETVEKKSKEALETNDLGMNCFDGNFQVHELMRIIGDARSTWDPGGLVYRMKMRKRQKSCNRTNGERKKGDARSARPKAKCDESDSCCDREKQI